MLTLFSLFSAFVNKSEWTMMFRPASSEQTRTLSNMDSSPDTEKS
jgi:hypothetical protein